MKSTHLYFVLIVTLGISCKRKQEPPAPLSQWNFDGVTFKGYARTFINGFSASENYGLRGSEVGNNYVQISFVYYYVPSKSGIFKVKKSVTDSSECRISVGIIGNSLTEYSSEDSNSVVMINVSPSGKLSASFSNIALKKSFNGNDIKYVSGTLIEQ